MGDDRRQDEGPWGYIPESGMTERHFKIFQDAAYDLTVEIVVRNTNLKSTPWIRKGYPPKPKELEFLNTDKETGRVTADSEDKIRNARERGFWVIDRDGIARDREGMDHAVDKTQDEVLAYGEVVDPARKQVLVGDYDLMGVYSPDPEKRRRNLLLLPSPGEKNYTNKTVRSVIEYVNARMVADGDLPRVLHGSDEHYVEKPQDKRYFKDGATVFYPAGTGRFLDRGLDVEWYYRSIKRKALWEDPYV